MHVTPCPSSSPPDIVMTQGLQPYLSAHTKTKQSRNKHIRYTLLWQTGHQQMIRKEIILGMNETCHLVRLWQMDRKSYIQSFWVGIFLYIWKLKIHKEYNFWAAVHYVRLGNFLLCSLPLHSWRFGALQPYTTLSFDQRESEREQSFLFLPPIAFIRSPR